MTKNNKIVAESLKNSGLKQKEFAQRLGISRSHLSMIVAGTGKASDALTELVRLKFSLVEQSLKTSETLQEGAPPQMIKLYEELLDAKNQIIELQNELIKAESKKDGERKKNII